MQNINFLDEMAVQCYVHMCLGCDIRRSPKPLSMYIFTQIDEDRERFLNETSCGSVNVNDCLMQMLGIRISIYFHEMLIEKNINIILVKVELYVQTISKPLIARTFLILYID